MFFTSPEKSVVIFDFEWYAVQLELVRSAEAPLGLIDEEDVARRVGGLWRHLRQALVAQNVIVPLESSELVFIRGALPKSIDPAVWCVDKELCHLGRRLQLRSLAPVPCDFFPLLAEHCRKAYSGLYSWQTGLLFQIDGTECLLRVKLNHIDVVLRGSPASKVAVALAHMLDLIEGTLSLDYETLCLNVAGLEHCLLPPEPIAFENLEAFRGNNGSTEQVFHILGHLGKNLETRMSRSNMRCSCFPPHDS